MKSNRWMSLVRVFFFVALAAAAAPSPAHAMPSDSGHFSIRREVSWGQVVLPPGDYSYDLEYDGGLSRVTIHTADGRPLAFVMSRSISISSQSEPTRLVLTTADGQTFVSALYLPQLGVTLNFQKADGKPYLAAVARNIPQPAPSAVFSPAK
jgi:hypothetical protein